MSARRTRPRRKNKNKNKTTDERDSTLLGLKIATFQKGFAFTVRLRERDWERDSMRKTTGCGGCAGRKKRCKKEAHEGSQVAWLYSYRTTPETAISQALSTILSTCSLATGEEA